ncbi:MAG: DEAD/DEAH box helicase [Xenococcus sp. (in: cyanobacteria)]
MLKLRDYQEQVRQGIYNLIRQGKKRILVMSPTGSGKSVVIAKLVQDALTKNKRILILVHRKKLIGQLQETITSLSGHSPALIAPRHKPDYENPVQIAMAQTLQKRELPPYINILIGDEAHITSYLAIWRKCLDKYCGSIWALSKAYVIGFTATPWRMQNKEGFCHLYERVVKAPSPRQLIKMGYLVNPRLFTYDVLDTAQLETDANGEYTLKSLQKTCTTEYNSDVISKWEDTCKQAKTVVFCVSVKQAEDLTQQYRDRGYTAEVVVGKTSEKQATEIFGRFREGTTQILVSVGKLTEGFDETSIESVVIARPTRSPALLIQMIGRGLRLHPGKTEVFIIDCGGCIEWLTTSKIKGFEVEDPIDLSIVPLCPLSRKKPWNETKVCPKCDYKLPSWSKLCSNCEHEFKGKLKVIPQVVEFPGLVEFFTPENRKQFNFIRSEIVKRFDTGVNPNDIFNKFYRKFSILPPYDYFLGAIFNLESPELTIEVYRYHLQQRIGLDKAETEFFIDLEFGQEGRVYRTSAYSYTKPKQTIGLFDPWHYLGVPPQASLAEIKQGYNQKIQNDCNKFALNYSFDILSAWVTSGVN